MVWQDGGGRMAEGGTLLLCESQVEWEKGKERSRLQV